MTPFVKLKKFGLAHAGAGWNRHVCPQVARYANKVIRRELRKEIDEFDLPRQPLTHYEMWGEDFDARYEVEREWLDARWEDWWEYEYA